MAAQVKVISLKGGVMNKPVKGAPYSGVEINESNQVLLDGTRIHNETQTQVFRDGEGRVRRENGNEITIFDPVANASYSLNAKTQVARKLPLGTYMFTSSPDGARANMQYFRFSTSADGPPNVERHLAEAKTVYANKVELDTVEAHAAAAQDLAKAVEQKIGMEQLKVTTRRPGNTESLGRRMMEGVNADGTRETATLEAGAIGNDRPILIVTESWFSADLQTMMLTRHSDLRMGEETFKLVNVSRGEPPAYLFQIPAGYQIIDQK